MNKRKSKINKKTDGSGRTVITCPICGAEVVRVYVPKEIADIFQIKEGHKFVCIGKFIYRSKATDLQFAKCYGIPVEGSLRMMQLEKPFTKDEIIEIWSNWYRRPYINDVVAVDGFFKNVLQYIPLADGFGCTDTKDAETEEDFDPKAFLNDDGGADDE